MPLMAAGVFYYIFNLVVAVVMEHVEKKLNYYADNAGRQKVSRLKEVLSLQA